MTTIQQALKYCNNNGVDLNTAHQLLAALLQKNTAYLLAHPQGLLTASQCDLFNDALKRLQNLEPLAYILGCADFYQHRFKVTPDVLIPRPATELLVEQTLALDCPHDAKILELGTGSGAIAISLALARSDWSIDATDVSQNALAIAKHNQQQLNAKNLNIFYSDWFSDISQQYDVIISNPPYIALDDPHCEKSVKQYEPHQALFADDNGLSAIHIIVKQATKYLKPRGYCLIEHGFMQQQAVSQRFKHSSFTSVQSWQDHQGHWRVSGGCYE